MAEVLSPPTAPHDISTTLNYFVPLDSNAPYDYIYGPPPGVPKSNIGVEPYPAVVHDVRGTPLEHGAELDVQGFQFVQHESREKDFVDEEGLKGGYYKEVEELLLKVVPGAKRVHVFDHTIRRREEDPVIRDQGARGPVLRVHVDQTYDAARGRVRRHLPDDADRLLQSRVRLINVWRPIAHPVYHNPLAVADWRSVDPAADLVHTRYIYPDFEGSTFNVKWNATHRWYYLAQQRPDEVLLVKCYDSEEADGARNGNGNVARAIPHSSFVDASSGPEKPRRQSIELRCLVFDAE
ncbi:hypothetical protein DENSPDRAFT_875222 [Dentipellis sp. KUC8613]|nr:hypothetical protein DENSPDRAFT_875222 [Dentipellis sp. KUC8613]